MEVVAAVIAALNARDTQAVDALFDDEVEWRPALTAGGGVEGSVYRGKSGMIKYVEEADIGFAEMRLEVERIVSVGTDRVFYRGRLIARGSASGIELDVPTWGLWKLRDGKLIRGDGFLTEAEALEAAGLSE